MNSYRGERSPSFDFDAPSADVASLRRTTRRPRAPMAPAAWAWLRLMTRRARPISGLNLEDANILRSPGEGTSSLNVSRRGNDGEIFSSSPYYLKEIAIGRGRQTFRLQRKNLLAGYLLDLRLSRQADLQTSEDSEESFGRLDLLDLRLWPTAFIRNVLLANLLVRLCILQLRVRAPHRQEISPVRPRTLSSQRAAADRR
ncbi:hypothetical protein THAOC_18724 [Thalassiosira oceanica]|uniref:Uncharacterized protein n=1 Tax=Thalassiosira oceanica TaxID=159749 RepID=K0SIL1_THAOC|nr:hypothetical protein THAOC_18724 [Thalassiosira oceanica]|eukprot:EJK60861.1 hypothetical protein THAOC_18724 [Thalassiosira oceanica]